MKLVMTKAELTKALKDRARDTTNDALNIQYNGTEPRLRVDLNHRQYDIPIEVQDA